MPLTPDERRLWDRVLALRPQFRPGHPERCPGIAVTLHAYPETCPECRDWLAEVLREDRRLEADARRPRA